MTSASPIPPYRVSVAADDIWEAIAETRDALWALVDQALLAHESHEIDEACDFCEFAQDLRRVLASHSDVGPSEDVSDTDI